MTGVQTCALPISLSLSLSLSPSPPLSPSLSGGEQESQGCLLFTWLGSGGLVNFLPPSGAIYYEAPALPPAGREEVQIYPRVPSGRRPTQYLRLAQGSDLIRLHRGGGRGRVTSGGVVTCGGLTQ